MRHEPIYCEDCDKLATRCIFERTIVVRSALTPDQSLDGNTFEEGSILEDDHEHYFCDEHML